MYSQIDCSKGQFCDLIVISIFRPQEESDSLSLMEMELCKGKIMDTMC